MQLHLTRAGSFLLPALLLLFHLVSPVTATPAPPLFELPDGVDGDDFVRNLLELQWMEPRGYDALGRFEEQRTAVLIDAAFEAWLSAKASEAEFMIPDSVQQSIGAMNDLLLEEAAVEFVRTNDDFTGEEITEVLSTKVFGRARPANYLPHLIHISSEREQAKEFVEELALKLTPENFGRYARLYSQMPSSSDGGRMGWISEDKAGPTFIQHLRKTPVGEIGGPYRTKSGWNIIYMEQVQPAAPEPSHSEAVGQARLFLAYERVRKMRADGHYFQQFIEENRIGEQQVLQLKSLFHQNYRITQSYINETLKDTPLPEDEVLREIYEEKREALVMPPRRLAREIQLFDKNLPKEPAREAWKARMKLRDQITAIYEVAINGGDFAELARQHSQASTAAEGGLVGWLQEPYDATYDIALGRIQPGEVTAPIEIPNGYMLLKLEDVEIGRPMSFEDSRDYLRRVWYRRQYDAKRDSLWREYLEDQSE